MFCRKCRYDLQGLSEPKCPECGAEFDPADSKTYLAAPAPESPFADAVLRVLQLVAVAVLAAGLIAIHLQARQGGH